MLSFLTIRSTLSSSRCLISYSPSHSIYAAPVYLSRILKTREDPAKVAPQTRPLSEVDLAPNQAPAPVEKKRRLEIELEHPEEQAIASTDARVTTTPQNSRPRKKRASNKKKHRHLPPEPYSHEDVLWSDVRDLLRVHVTDWVTEEGEGWESPFEYGEEIQVEVSAVSSTGVPLFRPFFYSYRQKLSFSLR